MAELVYPVGDFRDFQLWLVELIKCNPDLSLNQIRDEVDGMGKPIIIQAYIQTIKQTYRNKPLYSLQLPTNPTGRVTSGLSDFAYGKALRHQNSMLSQPQLQAVIAYTVATTPNRWLRQKLTKVMQEDRLWY